MIIMDFSFDIFDFLYELPAVVGIINDHMILFCPLLFL